MYLYSNERPNIVNGRKALLIDGSAVPSVSVMPLPSGLMQLTVSLREYASGELYSYAQHHVEITIGSLEIFFENYLEDPERTLAHFFKWTPQSPRYHAKPTITPEQLSAQAYADSLL